MGGEAKFFALYTRKAGWATAVAALYSIGGAAVNFKPNLEIRDVHFADPLAPPDSCPPRHLAPASGTDWRRTVFPLLVACLLHGGRLAKVL